MESTNLPLLILTLTILTLSIPNPVTAQFNSFLYYSCGNSTYTPNSPYKSNLNTVLNSLTNTQNTNGFYNSTTGTGLNRVTSLALCRGDVPVNTCRLCIQASATSLISTDNCPNQKQAFGYSDYCSIFFSNGSDVYGKVQDVQPWDVTNSVPVPNPNGFNESLYSLMSSLKVRAASGNSSLKYATGKGGFSGGRSLYGLVQCTPDLSRGDCMGCIQDSIDQFPVCCVKRDSMLSGVNLVQGSCFVQYQISSFIGNVPDFPMPPPLPPQNTNATPLVRKSKKSRIGTIIGAISMGIGVLTVLVIGVVCRRILLRRRRLRKSWMGKFTKDEVEALRSLQFGLGTIKNATNNFSDDNKLGQGGFGPVYKGVLSDGQEIAVKRLLRTSGQGDAEFKNEILILAKLLHKNLVKLLGFCLHGKEMILIYEFVANTSLDNFIFDTVSRQAMQWETRYKIINGIARGILYLHDGSRLKIIHRDLKAGNVLLDEDFCPKIADFGLARLVNIDQTQTVASKIVGTLGYISPEYATQNQVSVKSDVYSFGVLVLEIVSGQKITSFHYEENQENLLTFAWRHWNERTAWNLVDPVLLADSSTEILRCIHIGLLCVQDCPAERPTMSEVDVMLSTNSVTLEAPLQPAFCTDSQNLPNMLLEWSTTTKSSIRSSEGGSVNGVSINGVSITQLHPR